jgi:hypothetical protein
MITEEERYKYLDAIAVGIWSRPYKELTVEEKCVLDANLIARHLSGEITEEELYLLAVENEKYSRYGVRTIHDDQITKVIKEKLSEPTAYGLVWSDEIISYGKLKHVDDKDSGAYWLELPFKTHMEYGEIWYNPENKVLHVLLDNQYRCAVCGDLIGRPKFDIKGNPYCENHELLLLFEL